MKTQKDEIIVKLQRFCAYQERCHYEVRKKLLNINVYGDLLEEVMTDLIKEDYLNEQRYAEQFTGGRFRIKKWGRQKIKRHLKTNRVSEYCINKALTVINEEDYMRALNMQIIKYKKERSHLKLNERRLNNNCLQYCLNKGYEYGLIQGILNKKENDES